MTEPHAHPEPHPDVAGYLLGGLEPDEAMQFAEHLAGCDACRRELDELASLPDLLADVPAALALPAGLEERTFAAIAAAARADAGAALSDPASAPPTATDARAAALAELPEPPGDSPAATHGPGAPGGRHETVVAFRRSRPARPRLPRLLLSVAAAVIVVAAGVAALTQLGGGQPAPVATIRLIAADGGPARGTAVVRSEPGGLTIDMTVHSLPPSPAGTFYTCWLVGPGDTVAHPNRVSVGSFVVHGPGPVSVHWTTAADLRRFPHLGVTVEPDNGNPSHQGPKVLAAA